MPRRSARALLVILVGVVSTGLVAGSAIGEASTPVPFPANPTGLAAPGAVGNDLDATAGYQAQASCAVKPLPGTAKLRDLVLRTYGRGHDGGTIRSCVVGGLSEHKEGRAWDWMLNFDSAADKSAAADFLAWLTEDDGTMARRLGVMYAIYNQRMWRAYTGEWAVYTGADPHTSHVHVSLGWNGARGHTSFWTGHTWATDYGTCQIFRASPATVAGPRSRTTPCAAAVRPARAVERPMLWMGATGDPVRAAQRLLGTSVTGTFGIETRSGVLDYQRSHDLPPTGAVDRATWAALLPDQARSLHPEWTAEEARTWLREVAGSPELDRGSSGLAVTALQATLGLRVVQRTGFYGPRTEALESEQGR
jgi:peptidoglycan hydrolase-like protein with peptidoglycan-binding domain